MARLLLSGLTIVTMNDANDVVFGDVLVEDGKILSVGQAANVRASDARLDCAGLVAIPGLVQAHVHLTQTLFRNQADDLELLDWLRLKIWPFEAAHTEKTSLASARLGLAELLDGGTTAILDMGTVRHHDPVFEAAKESGIRYVGGKTMMDVADGGVPKGLQETTKSSLDESEALAKRWHGKGLLRYAYCPRFVVSCTDDLLRESAKRARALGTPVHVHASENKGEIDLVKKRTGKGNLVHLRDVGVLSAPAAVAHCVHLEEGDEDVLRAAGASAVHCPSSNLKLASGIAPVPRLLAARVNVALGADGAPCNNNLDAFLEMRLAGVIQKPQHGPKAMPAATVLRLATRGGAKALGLESEIGSIEPGKRADLALLDLVQPHSAPWSDPISAVVYAARPSNVKHVLVDGELVKRDFRLVRVDGQEVAARAVEALRGMAP